MRGLVGRRATVQLSSSPSIPCRDCPPESARDLPGGSGQPAAGPVYLRGADPASGPRRAAPGPATQTQVPLPAHCWAPLPKSCPPVHPPRALPGNPKPHPTPTLLPGWLLPLTALDRRPCLHAQIWGPRVLRRADSQSPSLHSFFWLHPVIPERGHLLTAGTLPKRPVLFLPRGLSGLATANPSQSIPPTTSALRRARPEQLTQPVSPLCPAAMLETWRAWGV